MNPWEQDWSSPAQSNASQNPWERDWGAASSQSDNIWADRARAFGYGAADAASFGFGDEGAGILAGIGASLSGGDYALAYRQRVDEARERLSEARSVHPISTLAGTAAGAIGTFLVPGGVAATGSRLGLSGVANAGRAVDAVVSARALPFGRTLTQAAAGRGGSALAARSGLGAMQGAGFGALYGAGSANENDRVRGAGSGALWGGAFGAVGPAVSQGMGQTGRLIFQNPALRSLAGSGIGAGVGYSQGETPEERTQNAVQGAVYGGLIGYGARPALAAARASWRNPIAAFGNRTGMSLGMPISDGATPPPAPEIADNVVRGVDRLVGREGYNVDELAGRIASARAEPLGRTLADVGGDQFLAKADGLAQLPGQTGPRAAAIAEQRARDLPQQITDELQSRLGISQSPTEAIRSLSDEYRQISRDLYEPLLRQNVADDAMARLQPIINRMPQSIRSRAERITDELAVIDGLTPAQMTGAQRIHYMKMALDDAISGAQQSEGLGAAQRAGLQRLKREFLEEIEGNAEQGIAPIIPGYRQARERWGGLKDAEEAMETGRRAVNSRPQEVRALMEGMTEFERRHFRIAAADELIRKVMRGSAAVGQRNAANPLNSNEIQGVIREIFDDPQEAQAFLRILNERNQLARNSAGWIGNSATARRAAQAGDQFMSAMSDAGANAAMGNPIGAAAQTGRAGINALRSLTFERENSALGNALLRSAERGDDEVYVNALIARLRQLEEARLQRAASAGREGALGGVGGGSYLDEGY